MGAKRHRLDGNAGPAPRKSGGSAAPLHLPFPPSEGPDIGGVLRGLRKQSGLSLSQVAAASGLSPSFLSAVERGESDISVQRLARVATVFNHDLGSLLGYSERRTRPRPVPAEDRIIVNRGERIEYEALRIMGTGFTFFVSTFAPRTSYESPLTHAGIDVCYVLEGEVVLTFDGEDYALKQGDCYTWPGSYPHLLRNDSNRRARIAAVTTEIVY